MDRRTIKRCTVNHKQIIEIYIRSMYKNRPFKINNNQLRLARNPTPTPTPTHFPNPTSPHTPTPRGARGVLTP